MPNSDKAVNWERLGQIVGVIAAVAGWMAVVGGARVWARLHNADIPTTQTLAVLPRQLLIVEGFQTLLAPVLIGGAVALFAYYSWPREDALGGSWTSDRGVWLPSAIGSGAPDGEKWLARPVLALKNANIDRYGTEIVLGTAAFGVLVGILTLTLLRVDWKWPLGAVGVAGALGGLAALALAKQRWPTVGRILLFVAAITPFTGAIVAVALDIRVGFFAAVLLVTFAVIWLTLGALVGASRGRVAVTLFAAFLFWAGAVSFLRELGLQHRTAEFQNAVVTRKNLAPLCGLYLGGAGGDVYVASFEDPHTVYLVKKDDVVALSFTQGSQQPCPMAPQRPRLSQLSLFALDEVIPDARGFSFPIGGGAENETYNLSFVASYHSPANKKVQRVTLAAKILTSKPHEQDVVSVPVAAIRSELQRGAPVLVTASIRGTSEHGISSATYSMCVIGRRRGPDESELKAAPPTPKHVIDLFPSRMVGNAPIC